MSGKKAAVKRQLNPSLKQQPKQSEEIVESEDESEDEGDLLKGIENEENDSSDDEGVDELYSSDDDEDPSFVADEEGNFEHIGEESDESGEGSEIDVGTSEDGGSGDEEDENDDDEEEGSDGTDDDREYAEEAESDDNASEDEMVAEKAASDASVNGEEEQEESNDDADEEEMSMEEVSRKVEQKDGVVPSPVVAKQAQNNSKIIKSNKQKVKQKPKPTKKTKLPKVVPKKDKIQNNASVTSTSAAKQEEKAPKSPKVRTKTANVAGTSNFQEYEGDDLDTSDEEDIRNTVGNIPMHWYDEYKHIGYDWDAKQIIKPAQGDQIDDFLKKIEDPNFWRTVKDPQTGQQVVLTDEDIDVIRRIGSGRVPDTAYNQYEPWIEWFTSEVEKMPIKNIPPHKRSFLPSQSDKKMVSRMVHALKMGWMKTTRELKEEKQKARGPRFFMLWESDTGRDDMRRIHDHVNAPKRDLPGHAESYNPPPEYLFDDKEMKEWHKLKGEPYKRKLHFLPQKFKSLREVPAYERYARERFLRCLDLYLCPRAKRMKLTIDAEYLVPKLPSPRDLQPYPTMESMVYRGHKDLVRTISVEPKGEYLVSGSDDMTAKIWEIVTGRCIRTIETGDIVRCVAWCPNPKLTIIAIASGNRVLLVNTKVGDDLLVKKTDDLLAADPQSEGLVDERVKNAVQWSKPSSQEHDSGARIILTHFKPVRQVTWHGRGDYFATVMPEGANRSAMIHQLSKRRSQIPFSKSKGLIQCVLFHPIKPCLFVATQHNIRIYDLVKQELIKKLLSASKWISNMAIHPKGDNLLVSTYDKKMLWFDLDLSTKPYNTMRLHKNAVRSVAYHLRYPLFASASDDQAVIVSHGMVYNDLLQNPLIVPLKKLETHEKRADFGVLDVVWHPMQPWVFSSGADTTIRLYS